MAQGGGPDDRPPTGWRASLVETSVHLGSRLFHAPDRLASLPPIPYLRARLAALPSRSWWPLILGVGFGVRILLAPLTAQTDLETFSEISVTTAYGGGIYTYPTIYPPGWIYLLNLLGRGTQIFTPANQLLFVNPHLLALFGRFGPIFPTALNVPTYSLLEKSVLWGFDLLLSFLLYQIVLETTGSVRSARFAFCLWFLNPLVITVTAVHGAYDVIPAFFAVAGVYLLVHRYSFSSGAAIASGVLLKLFPIFLLPVLFVVLVRLWPSSWRDRLREMALWGAGAAVVAAILLWPAGVVAQYVAFLMTGPSVGVPFGGFWIWSLTALPSASGFRSYLLAHSYQVALVSTAAALVAVLAIALLLTRAYRARESVTRPLTYAIFATIAVAYTTSPVTQAQYLLWCLPWIVLIAAQDRRFLPAIVWISALTLPYYFLGLEGPYFLLEPFAQFTPWLSFDTVVRSVYAWQPEIPTIRMITTIAVFVAILYCVVRSVREVARSPGKGPLVPEGS